MNDDIERECRKLIKTWRTVAEQELDEGVEFPPKMACLDTHEQLADELEAVLDGETPLEAADEKPCGTYHPLPCGLDVACPESDYVPVDALEERVSEWEEVASWGERDEMSRYEKGLKDDGKDKANELRELIEEYTDE